MLRAGDEIGDSQQGNNNAFCQDNAISWVDWPAGDPALLGFTRKVIAFRKAHPCLRPSRFLHGRRRAEDGEEADRKSTRLNSSHKCASPLPASPWKNTYHI